MPHFEVIARLKIRPGELEGFKTQAAELMRLTREYDRKTLRYDWYIDEDAMECEVHEDYVDESGLIEHNEHIVDARGLLFETYASDHRMSVYGEISPQLAELFKHHAAGVAVHHFFQGLEQQAAVSGGALAAGTSVRDVIAAQVRRSRRCSQRHPATVCSTTRRLGRALRSC